MQHGATMGNSAGAAGVMPGVIKGVPVSGASSHTQHKVCFVNPRNLKGQSSGVILLLCYGSRVKRKAQHLICFFLNRHLSLIGCYKQLSKLKSF